MAFGIGCVQEATACLFARAVAGVGAGGCPSSSQIVPCFAGVPPCLTGSWTRQTRIQMLMRFTQPLELLRDDGGWACRRTVARIVAAMVLLCWLPMTSCTAAEPFAIQVVDRETKWPVPLVELRTTHHLRFVTDNAGRVALDAPELMNVPTWLHVRGHGYSVPKDGFGFSGVRVVPKPGEILVIEVDRALPAKRLGRITGGGLFAESQKLGLELDWKEQGILGCDSVQNAVHRGKLFWAWGDTNLPGYPLGRFHMIGATTSTRPLQSFQPPLRLRYDYYVDDAAVPRNLAEMPGKGPTWLGGFASLPQSDGVTRLVATYSKIQPPMQEYERGLCVWNEETAKFDKHRVLWTRSQDSEEPPPAPLGHPVFTVDEQGRRWAWFGDPFPALRCLATFDAWSDPESWEVLEPQESVSAADDPKKSIKPHRGAVAWNGFRKKWVAIFTQFGGSNSMLGEIWYAEADKPDGPWGDAIKVVTHDRYTFYNPQLHPEFTDSDSPVLLFEATYTHTFSASQEPTPRHDYNQVLYRLDLDELP